MKLNKDSRFWALLINVIILLLGTGFGYYALPKLWAFFGLTAFWATSGLINALIGFLLFFVIIWLVRPFRGRLIKKIEAIIEGLSIGDVLIAAIGVILGLIIAWLINMTLVGLDLPFLSDIFPIILTVVFAGLGYAIAWMKRADIRNFFMRFGNMMPGHKEATAGDALTKAPVETPTLPENEDDLSVIKEKAEFYQSEQFQPVKVLDTSAIIDGRIQTVLKSGFMEGVLVVPNFVLKELQYIADSADASKRVRGRRGLDILNDMQEDPNITIELYPGDFIEEEEVDLKLLMLAEKLNGVVVTTDYNLNKVSHFHGIKVLNVNELASALKPVVIPGDQLTVKITKSGTERKQGVAYLDDGTMIVVEEGKDHIGETINVEITGAIQTNAGKMFFADIVK